METGIKATIKRILLEEQLQSQVSTPESSISKKPCRICKGAVEDGADHYFYIKYDDEGRAVKCFLIDVCLSCIKKIHLKEEQGEMARKLGGLRSLSEFTKEKFTVSEANKKAFEICDAFNPETDNIYHFGATGTGKSHLAVIAARKFWQKVEIVKPCEIFRSIRSCEGAEGETEVISSYAQSLVLVIDDLGVGKDTEFAVTSMYEIIDRRYQSMLGGLIVTTNLSPDDLAKKLGDDRIPSRLAQMCKGHIFSLSDQDWRIK